MASYLVTQWKRNLDGDIQEHLYRFDDLSKREVMQFIHGLKQDDKTDSVFINDIT